MRDKGRDIEERQRDRETENRERETHSETGRGGEKQRERKI